VLLTSGSPNNLWRINWKNIDSIPGWDIKKSSTITQAFERLLEKRAIRDSSPCFPWTSDEERVFKEKIEKIRRDKETSLSEIPIPWNDISFFMRGRFPEKFAEDDTRYTQLSLMRHLVNRLRPGGCMTSNVNSYKSWTDEEVEKLATLVADNLSYKSSKEGSLLWTIDWTTVKAHFNTLFQRSIRVNDYWSILMKRKSFSSQSPKSPWAPAEIDFFKQLIQTYKSQQRTFHLPWKLIQERMEKAYPLHHASDSTRYDLLSLMRHVHDIYPKKPGSGL